MKLQAGQTVGVVLADTQEQFIQSGAMLWILNEVVLNYRKCGVEHPMEDRCHIIVYIALHFRVQRKEKQKEATS